MKIEAASLTLTGIRHAFFTRAGGVSSGLYATLNGGVGSVNGTTAHDQLGCPADSTKCTGRTNLITPGSSSGVNWYAVPRQAEFGVKLSF